MRTSSIFTDLKSNRPKYLNIGGETEALKRLEANFNKRVSITRLPYYNDKSVQIYMLHNVSFLVVDHFEHFIFILLLSGENQ